MAVASRCPERFCLAASMSRSTSRSVRYSRLRLPTVTFTELLPRGGQGVGRGFTSNVQWKHLTRSTYHPPQWGAEMDRKLKSFSTPSNSAPPRALKSTPVIKRDGCLIPPYIGGRIEATAGRRREVIFEGTGAVAVQQERSAGQECHPRQSQRCRWVNDVIAPSWYNAVTLCGIMFWLPLIRGGRRASDGRPRARNKAVV